MAHLTFRMNLINFEPIFIIGVNIFYEIWSIGLIILIIFFCFIFNAVHFFFCFLKIGIYSNRISSFHNFINIIYMQFAYDYIVNSICKIFPPFFLIFIFFGNFHFFLNFHFCFILFQICSF